MKRHRATNIVGMALLAGMSVGLSSVATPAFASWPESAIDSTLKASTKKTKKKTVTKKQNSLDLTLIKQPAVTTFDGKTINKALAQTIAGKSPLLAWGNCSAYQKSDGSYTANRRAAGASPVSCMYLVTGSQSQFSEYYVLDQACTAPNQTCLSGYTVETRVDSTITTNPHSRDKTVELVSTIYQNSTLEPTPKITATVGGQAVTPIDTMQHKATVRASVGLGIGSTSYEFEMRDAAGNVIGTPIAAVRSDSSSGSGQSSCDQTGAKVEKFVQLGYELVGAGAGLLSVVVGGIAGASAGGIGFVPGVATGAAFGVAAHTWITVFGKFVGAVAGEVTTATCRKMAATNATPGGGGPIDPGAGRGLPAEAVKGGCQYCRKQEEQVISTFHYEDGEVTITGHSETVCTDWVLVLDGTDSNQDGWCD